MKWIIDRIEENQAVIEAENEKHFNVELSALPDGVKEGDVLEIVINNSETQDRKEKINKLMDSLFKD